MARKLCCELRRVQVRVFAGRELATKKRRRRNALLHLGGVERLDVLVGALANPLDLVRLVRDRKLAGALKVDLETVFGNERLDRIEVLVAEATQRIDLFGPARLCVRLAVRNARLAETTVATRSSPADVLRLEQHDATLGVLGLQLDGGPETRVAAADHHVVGLPRTGQRLVARCALLNVFDPVAAELGARERLIDDRLSRRVLLENGGLHGYLASLRCVLMSENVRLRGASPLLGEDHWA